jgi:integrase
VSAERFLIQIPDDTAAGLAAIEREKRASRRTRPPSLLWFRLERMPSPAEVEVLRSYLLSEGKIRDATITSVLAYGGLLQREVAALRWPDVGADELVVRKWRKRVGHGRPARRVPLIGPLADDLAEWRRLSEPPRPRELIFPSEAGPQWGGPEWNAWEQDVFEPAVEACGLKLESLEDLRHTFCTLTLYEGLPTRELARRIGMRSAEAKHRFGWLAGLIESRDPVDPSTLVRAARGAMGLVAL